MTWSKTSRAAERTAAVGAAVLAGLLAACAADDRLGPIQNARPGDPTSFQIETGAQAVEVGNARMAAGDPNGALRAYALAASEMGYTAEILAATGAAHLELGRLAQAERFLRAATERDPTAETAWNNLGVTLLSQNNVLEAEAALRVAASLDDGSSPEIAENLALAETRVANLASVDDPETNFRLVRRGFGSYLLVGQEN